MHRSSYMLPAIVATLLLLCAPAASAATGEPSQCRSECTVKHSPRAELLNEIHASLPGIGGRWSIYCTPDHPVTMHCWARNPAARFARHYDAAIFDGGYDLFASAPWVLRRLKPVVSGGSPGI